MPGVVAACVSSSVAGACCASPWATMRSTVRLAHLLVSDAAQAASTIRQRTMPTTATIWSLIVAPGGHSGACALLGQSIRQAVSARLVPVHPGLGVPRVALGTGPSASAVGSVDDAAV